MAFNCVGAEPYEQALETSLLIIGITFWNDVALAVYAAENRGKDVPVADGDHWNEKWHERVADAITKHFRREVRAKPRL